MLVFFLTWSKKKSLQQRVWLCGGMGVSFIPNITILMALMLFFEKEKKEGEGRWRERERWREKASQHSASFYRLSRFYNTGRKLFSTVECYYGYVLKVHSTALSSARGIVLLCFDALFSTLALFPTIIFLSCLRIV